MNGLAFEHYVDQPWLLFHLWHTEVLQTKLRNSVEEAIDARRQIEEITVARLRWYPALVGALIMEGLITVQDIERILNNPVSRFYALASNYEALAPVLESKLLVDAEGVERLVRWLRYKNFKPFRDEREYMAMLGEDPNRHYRLTPPAERMSPEQVRAEAEKRKHQSAAWAYLFVSSSQDPLLDAALVSVLKTNEEYAYLSAYVLRRRNFEMSRWVELVTNIKTPRWAFHVMRDIEPGAAMPLETRTRLLRCVHTSPPWAVQLWESRGWRGEHLRNAAYECGVISAGHECDVELSAWLRLAKLNAGQKVLELEAV